MNNTVPPGAAFIEPAASPDCRPENITRALILFAGSVDDQVTNASPKSFTAMEAFQSCELPLAKKRPLWRTVSASVSNS